MSEQLQEELEELNEEVSNLRYEAEEAKEELANIEDSISKLYKEFKHSLDAYKEGRHARDVTLADVAQQFVDDFENEFKEYL